MGVATVPFTKDADVQELLGILRGNNLDTRDLTAIVGSVTAMERQLSAAMADLTAMRRELATMRYENNHPVKTALEKAARSLSEKISGILAKLRAVKDKIISGCKRAIAACGDKGVTALNNLAEFFQIKPALESLRDSINDGIQSNRASITKIERVGEEYHSAARHIRNLGRIMRGQELVPEIKPNGTLARLAEAPFRLQLRSLNGSLHHANGALAGLDRLEKAAARRAEQASPSIQERMAAAQVRVEQQKRDTPAQQKSRQSEVAI